VALAVCGWLACVLTLEIRNPRLVPSWHGFLHTAITNRFPTSRLIPENPFFAGEPLPYYWAFHRIAAVVSSAFGLDPLSSLRLLTLVGLVLLVVTAALIGRRVFRSTAAGLMIGVLALVGSNPLGPAIAAARRVTQDVTLFEQESGAPNVETTFSSNEAADRLMSRNLLGRMYFSTDWRHGQNIVWFFDISSRGLALGTVMLLVWLTLTSGPGWGRFLSTMLTTALLAALNPIVGLAVAGFLGMALLGVNLASRVKQTPTVISTVAALATGVVLATPTFYHLFTHGGGGATLTRTDILGTRILNLGINFLILLPLALLATRMNLGRWTLSIRAITLTGLSLLLVMIIVHLEEGNEHNLTNAAQVLLAAPAVAWLVLRRDGTPRPNAAKRCALVAALFVPVTAGTWLAFDGRPALPFKTNGGELVREPSDSPLARLYDWITRQTPKDAVFVIDPDHPVKMSGNVSELPAFTGRTLFIDYPSYLTTPYPDTERRNLLARRLVAGEVPSSEDEAYLWRVRRTRRPVNAGPRPMYVVTYRADSPGVLDSLAATYGAPVFRSSFVAVFPIPQRSVLPR
jgi:hypothetical protein